MFNIWLTYKLDLCLSIISSINIKNDHQCVQAKTWRLGCVGGVLDREKKQISQSSNTNSSIKSTNVYLKPHV